MWTPGNASMFGWLLEEKGYNVTTNWNSSLDSGILLGYGILCLFFPMIPLTVGEVSAVQSFVDSGGGLLLVGVDYTTAGWKYTPANLNPVSSSYGIVFNNDTLLGRSLRSSGEISNHNVTLDVLSLHSSCDQLTGCSLNVASPAVSLATIKGKSVLAVSQSGSGRVVAVGSPAPFIEYRHDRGWQVSKDDHFQLTLNIIDWLAGNAHRLVEPLGTAIFRVGAGPSLNSTEIEQYTLFDGVIHDHTTVSDGGDTPPDMVVAGLSASLDFFVVTDHVHMTVGQEGIYGALAAKAYAQTFGLECPVIVGAELSSIQHTIGFPLTANIYTLNQSEGVNSIHAQGGIAGMAHPTMDASEIPVWEAFDTLGYDAFEVTNDGFFQALGESCYSRSFYGASDSHGASGLGYIRDVAFVKNPTGPGGTISGLDLADAVVNRRIVVLDLVNDMIFGQAVWVNRFLEVWNEAETAINNTQSQIESLESGNVSLGLSRMYLQKAESAMEWWNPCAALKAADDALLQTVEGLDLATTAPNLGVVDAKGDVALSIKLTNRHDYGVKLNATPFVNRNMVPDNPSTSIPASPLSTQITSVTGKAAYFGYLNLMVNLHDFNTTEKPGALIMHMGGIISNISMTISNSSQGTAFTIKLIVHRGDNVMITSAKLRYNNGTLYTANLVYDGEGYGLTVGPYKPSVNVTFEFLVDDILGNSFIIDGGIYHILQNVTTTVTTTSTVAPGLGLETIAIIVVGAAAALLVIVVLLRKRG